MSRVFLIEDDIALQRLLKQVLEKAGYDVTTACDGEEALYVTCNQTEFDCIITDINMPKWQGDQVLELLEVEDTDTKVIVITAYPDSPAAKRLKDAPEVSAFLEKPFKSSELVASVKAALDSSD